MAIFIPPMECCPQDNPEPADLQPSPWHASTPDVSDVPDEVKAQIAPHLRPVFVQQALAGTELQESIDLINAKFTLVCWPRR